MEPPQGNDEYRRRDDPRTGAGFCLQNSDKGKWPENVELFFN
jgi:hypothetical protein